jgi:hypothetical protein
VQEDFYELQFNNIISSGVDVKTLIDDRIFNADNISLQPIIKIFSDRTLPPDLQSKVGKYPHQVIAAIKDPFHIRKLNVKNGYVSYRERGAISAQIGQIFFDKLSATLSNVTNIKGNISKDPNLVLNATSKFMGVSNFNTKWIMPLNTSNGAFTIDGNLDKFEGKVVNAALEPQGMASIKKGNINGFSFNTKGNDLMAHTTGTLLYDDLKLELLKKESDENDLQKKKALSLLANIFIKDANPRKGVTRKNEVNLKRDTTRSFFNLVWKSLFAVIKKTMTGKDNAE